MTLLQVEKKVEEKREALEKKEEEKHWPVFSFLPLFSFPFATGSHI